jgi:hypothetical protein
MQDQESIKSVFVCNRRNRRIINQWFEQQCACDHDWQQMPWSTLRQIHFKRASVKRAFDSFARLNSILVADTVDEYQQQQEHKWNRLATTYRTHHQVDN